MSVERSPVAIVSVATCAEPEKELLADGRVNLEIKRVVIIGNEILRAFFRRVPISSVHDLGKQQNQS